MINLQILQYMINLQYYFNLAYLFIIMIQQNALRVRMLMLVYLQPFYSMVYRARDLARNKLQMYGK